MSRNPVARLCLWLCLTGAGAAQAEPGFLLVAPDRGFTGNEAVRDAFAPFASRHPAELVFVTAKETEERLDRALGALRERGADPVVVLPFYLSAVHPDVGRIDAWHRGGDVLVGRLFGRSAAAPAALQKALFALETPARTRLVLVGHGAETSSEAEGMARDLSALLAAAAEGSGFASLEAAVWPGVDELDQDALREKLAGFKAGGESARVVLLPFHLGPDLDAMMGFTPRLRHAAPDGTDVPEATSALASAIPRWLAREAARYATPASRETGVIVHAHGASWNWNETMRRGAALLENEYLVEYAFSMGDPATLEHAIRHLEERGAKAIVIVRVFGMANSFREGIERFTGQAWESCHAPAGAQHRHGHDAEGTPAPLLRTRLPVVTVGGLEDHPLFARALHERVLELSERPERETVILVAHGLGDEEGNAHWRRVLESVREQMLAAGGNRFRAIEAGLWSEDWPELRESAVEHVRGLVAKASADGGRAIVVPARTLGEGPADEYLKGLDYALGEGFAPHPLFAEWLRVQVHAGLDALRYRPNADPNCS